ncbi:hypothetical protein Agabi119p4_10361 [Agaricus bisporus var. burnettii]|uniref:Uncharacterized protein n=1 Tax=Agaricus bisporus var. burnettii TaxID=192524 RepID=A0A8H7C1W7_AGABI|nr:hypothetical protein Agabi119p4_10361 [Agaricus bisporus var. burnettii]
MPPTKSRLGTLLPEGEEKENNTDPAVGRSKGKGKANEQASGETSGAPDEDQNEPSRPRRPLMSRRARTRIVLSESEGFEPSEDDTSRDGPVEKASKVSEPTCSPANPTPPVRKLASNQYIAEDGVLGTVVQVRMPTKKERAWVKKHQTYDDSGLKTYPPVIYPPSPPPPANAAPPVRIFFTL